MKTIRTENYDGTILYVPVSDEVYEALRELRNDVQALEHREAYQRKRVFYGEETYFRYRRSVPSPEAGYLTRETDRALYEAIDRCLTPVQRRRVLLVLDGGLSVQEVARREARTYRSIQQSLFAALHKLRGVMEHPVDI